MIDIEKRIERLIAGYQEWLEIIGYSPSTVKLFPLRTARLLYYLQQSGHLRNSTHSNPLCHLPETAITEYYETLKNTPSEFTGRYLTASGLNGYILNLKLFHKYLKETDQGSLPMTIKREKAGQAEVEVLSQKEIKQLYHSTTETEEGLRERAVLSLYYGCGLRRKEGLNLNLKDVQLEKQVVHIRKSKTNRARYVPFLAHQKQELEQYLIYYRNIYAKPGEASFLIGNKGERMGVYRLYQLLKNLLERAGLEERKIGVHTLRHSIATHLLQSGMNIENIAQFLGHQWVSSTQIYLHLKHDE